MGFIINPYRFAAVFNPLTVTGCKLWLKSDAGITKDGGNLVSQWDDQSGQANHLVQATGTNKPLWVDNNRSAKPTINFDGVDNFMKVTSFAGGSIAHPRYLFIVAKEPSATSMGFMAEDDENDPRFRLTGGYDISDQLDLTGGTVALNTWHYYTILWNGASSDLRRNAVSVLSGNSGSGGTFNGMTLGALSNGGYGDAQVAEVLLYNNDIGVTNRNSIEAYLATRWGL